MKPFLKTAYINIILDKNGLTTEKLLVCIFSWAYKHLKKMSTKKFTEKNG